MPGPGRVENAIGEPQRDEPPERGWVAVQGVHPLGHEVGEARLLAEKEAGDAPFRPAAAFAAADRERPMGELSGRGGCVKEEDRERGHRSGRLRHGQATIAVLAILNPKLAPGERLVK